jgi:gliding motility-associated-like protein
VILTDANGCTATDTVRLNIRTVVCDEPDIFIPNAFSPNNDQRNDIFLVRSGFLTEMHLRIYDRWGELVFESRDLNKGWDGRFKGETVPPDVYVYTVEGTCFDRAEFRKQGNVTVIR